MCLLYIHYYIQHERAHAGKLPVAVAVPPSLKTYVVAKWQNESWALNGSKSRPVFTTFERK